MGKDLEGVNVLLGLPRRVRLFTMHVRNLDVIQARPFTVL